MTDKKTWFITGSGRGMGADFASAEPYGIHTTIVNPEMFRTELLTDESATYAKPAIGDCAERSATLRGWFQDQNGRQEGDPAKLARALLSIAEEAQPPCRFIAGADAVRMAEQKVAALEAEIDASDELSSSLAYEDATAGVR